MKNKNYFLAAIVGGIAFFFLGWIIWGMVLMNFMTENSGLPADILAKVNKPEEEFIWWALVVANMASGFLLATIFDWGQITTAAGGAKSGAIVGFFIALSMDLLFYSMTNFFMPVALVVDIIASTVMFSIGGALIGMMLGKGLAKA